MNLTTVLEYFKLRRVVEAERVASLSVAQVDRFRELRTRCATPPFQALYERWVTRNDGSLSTTEVSAAARPDCALRAHALGRKYDAERATSDSGQITGKVT